METFETASLLFTTPHFEGSGTISAGYQNNKESYPVVKSRWKSVSMGVEPFTLSRNYSRVKKLDLPLASSGVWEQAYRIFCLFAVPCLPIFFLFEGELFTSGIIIALFNCGKAVK